jgi:hypothetical protein
MLKFYYSGARFPPDLASLTVTIALTPKTIA